MTTDSKATTTATPAVPLLPESISYSIPNGEYHATITQSLRQGDTLQAKFQLLRGKHNGQTIFAAFCFGEIKGRQLFQTLCTCAGICSPKDSSELHNRTVLVTIRNRTIDGAVIPFAVTFSKPLLTVEVAK